MTHARGMWLSLHSAWGLSLPWRPAVKRLVGRQPGASLGSARPSVSRDRCEHRAEVSPARF